MHQVAPGAQAKICDGCGKHLLRNPFIETFHLMILKGYPEDLIIGVALGADMFDCVWPTRTAVSSLP